MWCGVLLWFRVLFWQHSISDRPNTRTHNDPKHGTQNLGKIQNRDPRHIDPPAPDHQRHPYHYHFRLKIMLSSMMGVQRTAAGRLATTTATKSSSSSSTLRWNSGDASVMMVRDTYFLYRLMCVCVCVCCRERPHEFEIVGCRNPQNFILAKRVVWPFGGFFFAFGFIGTHKGFLACWLAFLSCL
jgi:hypothetical protein